MLDQQINEQLGLLQQELSKLKSATDYIDGAKLNSTSIIVELENVQQNYAIYTDKIFNLYEQYVTDLKNNTEAAINSGVLKFETTGHKIDTTNNEKLVETKRLLEQYKKIVDATDSLVKTLNGIDFPERLSLMDNKLSAIQAAFYESQSKTIRRLDYQKKEIKTLKIMSFVIAGLIILGTAATIFFLK